MATGSSAAFEGNPPGTACRAAAGVGAQHNKEPCAVCALTLSAYQPGISNSHNAVEQANIKAQFEARAGFPNGIGAIDCTHIAIKAPSHDEFVYQQETFSFDQCTDHM